MKTGCSILLLALAAWLDCGAARADDGVFNHPLDAAQLETLLGPAAKTLASAPGLRGQFEQRKYLSDLPRPLLSTGDFLFARELGVWWHTATPFDSVFVLTPAGMRLRDEGGKETRVGVGDQPGIAVAVRLFSALFGLDFKALAGDFDLYGVLLKQGAAWQVGLKPHLPAMQAVLTQATIDGSDRVSRIELLDAHGDRTEIRMLKVEVLTGGLSAEERARFSEKP